MKVGRDAVKDFLAGEAKSLASDVAGSVAGPVGEWATSQALGFLGLEGEADPADPLTADHIAGIEDKLSGIHADLQQITNRQEQIFASLHKSIQDLLLQHFEMGGVEPIEEIKEKFERIALLTNKHDSGTALKREVQELKDHILNQGHGILTCLNTIHDILVGNLDIDPDTSGALEEVVAKLSELAAQDAADPEYQITGFYQSVIDYLHNMMLIQVKGLSVMANVHVMEKEDHELESLANKVNENLVVQRELALSLIPDWAFSEERGDTVWITGQNIFNGSSLFVKNAAADSKDAVAYTTKEALHHMTDATGVWATDEALYRAALLHRFGVKGGGPEATAEVKNIIVHSEPIVAQLELMLMMPGCSEQWTMIPRKFTFPQLETSQAPVTKSDDWHSPMYHWGDDLFHIGAFDKDNGLLRVLSVPAPHPVAPSVAERPLVRLENAPLGGFFPKGMLYFRFVPAHGKWPRGQAPRAEWDPERGKIYLFKPYLGADHTLEFAGEIALPYGHLICMTQNVQPGDKAMYVKCPKYSDPDVVDTLETAAGMMFEGVGFELTDKRSEAAYFSMDGGMSTNQSVEWTRTFDQQFDRAVWEQFPMTWFT